MKRAALGARSRIPTRPVSEVFHGTTCLPTQARHELLDCTPFAPHYLIEPEIYLLSIPKADFVPTNREVPGVPLGSTKTLNLVERTTLANLRKKAQRVEGVTV